MTKKNNSPVHKNDLDPEKILSYLQENPDFREQILEQFDPSDRDTKQGTISFSSKKLDSVSKKLSQTESKLAELIQNSTDNSRLFEYCHNLILALLDTADSTSFLEALSDSLKHDFKFADHHLFVFSDQQSKINKHAGFIQRETLEQQLGGIVSSHQPTLGILREEEKKLLFPDNHLAIGSAAVLPINNEQPIALLTLGSRDQNDFRSDLETSFVKLITDVLSRLLPERVIPGPSPGTTG
jgi:uncharacterized protein YigA (DUF484 family)